MNEENEPRQEAPLSVSAIVKVVPAKRTATFDVPLSAKSNHKLRAAVNTKSITFAFASDIPKTLEAADAIIALAQAVREELLEQAAPSESSYEISRPELSEYGRGREDGLGQVGDRELRLAALNLADSRTNSSSSTVMTRAKEYYAFLRGEVG